MFKDLKDKIQKLNKGNNTIINISTWIFIAVIVAFVFYLIWIGSQNIYYSLFNSEKAGQIGDSAGLLNSLFSGFAFLGVIVTIILQSRELKQTTTELKNQKIEFEKQNQTLKRQQFENTFFNMLSRQENIISAITYGAAAHGRQAFMYTLSDLKKNLIEFGNTLTEIQNTYKSVCLNNLGYYFCHLYRIIKFVHENKFLTDEEKSNYIDIVRAGLSPYEVVLLFYNGLVFGKTKIFIEKYKLLDPLIFEFLPIRKHIMLYDIKAYGNNEYLINLYNAFPIIKKILAEKLSSIDAKVYISDFGTELSCDLYFVLYLKDKKIDVDEIILALDKEFKEKLNSIKINIFNGIAPNEDSVEFKYNNGLI